MSIRVAIRHHTEYHYDRPVKLSPHIFRLKPAPHCRTAIESYSFKLEPNNYFINWQQDPFGNYLSRVVFPEKTNRLIVDIEVIANLSIINPFDFFLEESASHYPFQYDEQLKRELLPYLEVREDGLLLRDWIKKINRERLGTVDFLVMLNQMLWKDIAYTIRLEPGVQSCEETLTKKSGSCRDSAWLLVQIVRHLGLAARFVSGYLIQLKPDVKAIDGPSGSEHDFTDLHAWAEVYIPGAGWIGFDPTSGLLAAEGHIPLAATPDFQSAAPVTGATDICEVTFSYHNTVERIYERPRVTKPFSEESWNEILKLGEAVDLRLQAGDVRLTMGGEPTFVSIDDMESAQWNTAADGGHKRHLANDLVKRLRLTFAPGGLLHFGQGKWYPGEELPRWQYGCYWRKDGIPIWHNDALFADIENDYGFTHKNAEQFGLLLANKIGLSQEFLTVAFEDAIYYAVKEQELPPNIDPHQFDLKDSLERKRLARLLERGMETPAGYALPIMWDLAEDTWVSCDWKFKREKCYLLAGDSPMGYRLPLKSLPYLAPEKRPIDLPRDLHQPLPPLDDFSLQTERDATQARTKSKASEWKETGKLREVIYTAICLEARAGKLYVFMPPVSYLEHYLKLVAVIEETARELSMPIILEGYEPPRDYRLEVLKVTPDPGVIEVNIHPSKTWSELVKKIESLYETARHARLGTEKFMLDGRHTGSGGGNHITISSSTPSDSPLLRKPDLLRSLITYWQHHPSLSYLFSSAFIGPTSQAPRVDEGRDERLYELEIAFSNIKEGIESQPFWLIDRLLRHLLTDLSGNTHRSEFCIDKLFSPNSPTGRLGILEFRGFEMPPHYQMSLLQQLLVRALIAKFWERPYKKPLVRWGTALHDKFMLPHYVKSDLYHVLEDLAEDGFQFDPHWFDSFLEFRFPHYGTTKLGDMAIELRAGIEPWHVLGEEMSNMGTARFVDSSVERLQVKLSGLIDSRHALLCNGVRVPLHATGKQGEYVCGIRYKAWAPPSALHPTINAQTPLVFDLVDLWNERAVGGCVYHVVHPGGRNYETFPVNAYEAEGRRINRFEEGGFTPSTLLPPPEITGAYRSFSEVRYESVKDIKSLTSATAFQALLPPKMIKVKELSESLEYPYTLDLRRQF
ncbi:MAG: transglutaminase family protein [Chloroherpetonaceae bacterium]|nr:transglutaminase family protein [Chloroherpetonaceae bacterium]